jgi:lipid A 3-O-deacylase
MLGCVSAALAASPRNSFLTVTEENDDFARNGDRHYTQGARIAYTLSEEGTPDWVYSFSHWLPAMGMDIEAPRFGYALGQSIYTPANLRTSSLMSGDRPYAGYLYFGIYIQRRGTMGTVPVLDTAELDVGLIGPESFARNTQSWWHGIGEWVQPQGWDNQLRTEPGLTLKLNRQWKLSPTKPEDGWGFEVIPHVGVSVGNVTTFASAGAMVRAGYNIPDDFGVQNIDSLATQYGGRNSKTPLWGGYVFAGVDGRAIAHNSFLDGNLWQRSHSVHKEPFVGDFKAGAVLNFRYFDVGATFIMRSREFKGQSKNDRFGGITLNAKF